MSWTKTEHWDAICEMMNPASEFEEDGANEPEYLNWYLVEPVETAIDWFSDRRLDYTGYEEFRCDLCDEFADNDFGHKECFDEENAWANRIGEDDLPF